MSETKPRTCPKCGPACNCEERAPEPWRSAEEMEHGEHLKFVACGSQVIAAVHSEKHRDRIISCVNACRGLKPEHVGELVGMVSRLRTLLMELGDRIVGSPLTEELFLSKAQMNATLERIGQAQRESKELLAKVKG